MNPYDLTGIFPGKDGTGQKTGTNHPAEYLNASDSITLANGESGIFIPTNNFKYGMEDGVLDTDSPNQDVRYLCWNILERFADFTADSTVGGDNVKSFIVTENLMQQQTGGQGGGEVRNKRYIVDFYFKPISQIELEQNVEFYINKSEATQE